MRLSTIIFVLALIGTFCLGVSVFQNMPSQKQIYKIISQ